MSFPRVVLKAGREKSLRYRHPWIFSGAIAKADAVDPGELVKVFGHDGTPLAVGYYNEHSQIRIRILSFASDTVIDSTFWRSKVRAACQNRERLIAQDTNAYRLVMSEADGLPGFVVDRFDNWLVMQCLTAGAERHRQHVLNALTAELSVDGVIDDSTDPIRKKEGLNARREMVYGDKPQPDKLVIKESGLCFATRPGSDQKTGFFFDQRDNRSLIRTLAKEHSFLDAFSYTGGFGVAAAMGGARTVTLLDRSEEALKLAAENFTLQASPVEPEFLLGNAFEILRELVHNKRTFSFINLDPPKFAANAAQLPKATRGYKDINLTAMRLLEPGGYLATYSCSGHMSSDLFQKVVFGAAIDAGRSFHVVANLRQAPCHPVHLNIPESFYLKGLLLKCTETP